MIRMEKKTSLAPADVLTRASTFFGKAGVGLEETARNPCCVSFEGGGGYVLVSVAEEPKQRSVTVEGREWEHHVREFLASL